MNKGNQNKIVVADSAEVKMLKKKIIEEELALLKAKHRVPAKSSNLASYPLAKRTAKHKDSVAAVNPEAKESLNSHIEEMKNKNTYVEIREEQKHKEEMRKKEASEFVKKLKQQK